MNLMIVTMGINNYRLLCPLAPLRVSEKKDEEYISLFFSVELGTRFVNKEMVNPPIFINTFQIKSHFLSSSI